MCPARSMACENRQSISLGSMAYSQVNGALLRDQAKHLGLQKKRSYQTLTLISNWGLNVTGDTQKTPLKHMH